MIARAVFAQAEERRSLEQELLYDPQVGTWNELQQDGIEGYLGDLEGLEYFGMPDLENIVA